MPGLIIDVLNSNFSALSAQVLKVYQKYRPINVFKTLLGIYHFVVESHAHLHFVLNNIMPILSKLTVIIMYNYNCCTLLKTINILVSKSLLKFAFLILKTK